MKHRGISRVEIFSYDEDYCYLRCVTFPYMLFPGLADVDCFYDFLFEQLFHVRKLLKVHS